jgi:hypothetical protein
LFDELQLVVSDDKLKFVGLLVWQIAANAVRMSAVP